MEISENLTHLNINIEDKNPVLSDTSPNDTAAFVPGFATLPMQISNYYWMPKQLTTGTLPITLFATTSLDFGLGSLDPTLFNLYRAARCTLSFKLIVRASWNHTGLVAFGYKPTYTLHGTKFAPSLDSKFLLYCSPQYRSYLRVGKDTETVINVPWLSNFAAWDTHESTTITPNKPADAGMQLFTLITQNVGSIRTTATSLQVVSYSIWVEPLNISVGAIKSNTGF